MSQQQSVSVETVRAILDASLAAKEEIRCYSDFAAFSALFPQYFRKSITERVSRGIHSRYICPASTKSHQALKQIVGPKRERQDFLEVLFINPAQFPFHNEIAIYDDKVAIMSLAKRETLGLLIESVTLAETMRSIFDLSWLGGTSFIAV